ncbi:hypothetical protein SMICM304S_11502 [Streptomyces microflavus]
MRGCCGDHTVACRPWPTAPPSDQGLSQRSAAVLVFGSSAAVLVVEIVALRLLAPYLGLTLETSTLVIGIALTAIALGSWLGGRVADQVDPHRLIPPRSGCRASSSPRSPRSCSAPPPSGPRRCSCWSRRGPSSCPARCSPR